MEFVQKLPLDLQAEVINARIRANSNLEILALFEGEHWTNILPAWRGILPPQDVAEKAYTVLRGYYPEIEVDQAVQRDGGVFVRLLTPAAYPVTPAVGDVLRMGVEVHFRIGGELEVVLYVKRLVCLNGMTANQRAFSWKKRDECDATSQLLFVEQGILHAIGRYCWIRGRLRYCFGPTRR